MTNEDSADQLPPLAPDAPKRPKGSRYRQQHGVVIVCEDEAGQRAVYEGLAAIGRGKLKVVST